MTVMLKTQRLTVPEEVTKKAGIKPGDVVEFTVRQGKITISASQLNEGRYPSYTPTKAESRAIARGLSEYKRGEFITLEQLHKEMDATRHKVRKKSTRKAS